MSHQNYNITGLYYAHCKVQRDVNGGTLDCGQVSLTGDYESLRKVYRELQRFFGESPDRRPLDEMVAAAESGVRVETDEYGEPRGIAPAVAIAEVRRRKAAGQ